jgi:putative transposase
MAVDLKLIDKLLADYRKPEDIVGENGLLKQLTKALLERAMQAEMTDHLGYEKHDPAGNNSGNSRNGETTKTLEGDLGELPLETPRDRNGSYEPKIISKGQTRFTGFDDKIISMYARGMSTREIQGHLEEIYKVEVSPTLISNVTEEVLEEVKSWQSRPLDAVYPIVYLDALMVRIREAGHVRNKAIYIVIGVNMQGNKEVLGLWAGQAEGAKFWLQVLTELKNRGVADMFIACVDGLKGFPESIPTVFPEAQVQLCIVYQVRASLNYAAVQLRTYDFGQPSASLADYISAGIFGVATCSLAETCDAPSYVARIPDHISPLLIAERLAEIWDRRVSRSETAEERIAHCEQHSFEYYAMRLTEILNV